ncbi:pumilio homolog 12-like [Quercus lobata]|uniref:PUM-HD domain-containing protein n=1 Tax=Quercus lobata TaxID=97700 RepID=A0A7N2LTU1_QUELO|nr:pumilio homolog 12-like [Quercus lobata]
MESRINFNEKPPAPTPNTTTNSGDSVTSNVESFAFNFANLRIATSSSSSPALNQTQQIHHTNGTAPPTLNTNSGDSVSSKVRSLPFNYANLRIATSSSSTSSPALNQTQQIHHTNANYETGLQHIPLSPFALYPQRQSIWSSPDNWLGGNYLCNGYYPNHQENSPSSANPGFEGASTSNWANQNDLGRYHAASVLQGRGDSVMNANLNLLGGGRSQNSSFDYPREVIESNRTNADCGYCQNFRASGCLRNQQSFGGVGYQGGGMLHSLQGNDIVTWANTQEGSQFLQEILASNNQEIINNLFDGVIDSLSKLMISKHGYYFFGKLVESVNDHQLQQIVVNIITLQPAGESLTRLSSNLHGSKSLQKLIKVLVEKPLLISEVISALSGEFLKLMKYRTGSLVLIKCLEVANAQSELLYDAAINNLCELAKDEEGCISLNKFITSSRGSGREQLLHAIAESSLYLSQDPSGNYVLQHVLGLDDPQVTNIICLRLKGHYAHLSSQKGGSYVVEKCLNSVGMNYVIEDFLSYNRLCQLARDQYGNYVIQAALKATKRVNSLYHERLLMILQGNMATLQSGYGRNVYSLIVKGVPLD